VAIRARPARPGATCLNRAVIPANPVWARGATARPGATEDRECPRREKPGLPWRDSPPWRDRNRRMPRREKPGLGQGRWRMPQSEKPGLGQGLGPGGIGGILEMSQFSLLEKVMTHHAARHDIRGIRW
jgi:hypothetical protein